MKKKKTIIGTLCLVLLSICFSCKQSPEDKLRNAFENEILKDMHDPSSYEFVSIEFLEPYTGLDKLKNDQQNYMEESNRVMSRTETLLRREIEIMRSLGVAIDDVAKKERNQIEIQLEMAKIQLMLAKYIGDTSRIEEMGELIIEALELHHDILLSWIEEYKSNIASGVLLDYSRNNLQRTTKQAESIQSEIETHKTVLDDLSRKIENKDKIDEIIFLKASIKIRAKNALGALVLSEYLIQYDEDYNVLGISEI